MSFRPLRALTVALTGVALLSAAACGAGDPTKNAGAAGTSGASGRIRVGISVYDTSSFITAGKAGIDAYAKANDIDVLFNS
ncbi:MAG: xylitol/threitol ABC transporter substrate-binding protein, partial [Lapillicoccus sp.]